ncbi:PaaX family transcriptional regulator [Streptomyces sp. NPDC004838]
MSTAQYDDEPGSARGAKPRALIVTIYGLYARDAGGWLSVSSLIRLMGTVGVDETAVRSSISRLKRRGILVAERVDGAAGYALSESARTILLDGDQRIFRRTRAVADDAWVMVVFSIPEAEREKRHQLRSQLSGLGFGTVASGVWVAPAHVEHEARSALTDSGLTEYVDLFRADHVAFRPPAEAVTSWWDLGELERMYEEFIAQHGPTLSRWQQRSPEDDEKSWAAAFADLVSTLTHWRRLPYHDPGLPAEFLPPDWHGARAADVFFELHERLAPAARRHVEAVTRPRSAAPTA